VATEGGIFAYTHHSGKVVALVEVGCETDFAARSSQFRDLGNALAMQVAAMDPPDAEALMDTASIFDAALTVLQQVEHVRAVLGEKVEIRRFIRWSLGD
jgi:elongation factor Ts